MIRKSKYFFLIGCLSFCIQATGQNKTASPYQQPFRPQLHFSPQEHWMNDPNGLVYVDHTYHLFFQYYPGGTVWGPMHWGHAVSNDLVHWKQLSIALYPDSLGYIFSGSAVVDYNNTTGFGMNGRIPLVAMFTHHDPVGAKQGKNNFQNQSLAYSLDKGRSWIKYKGNPVLKNPGITDFRDPKVMWYQKQKKWVLTLATKDRITFYSSPNMKTWNKESEFGAATGAHGGVWECPDLFPLKLNDKTYWVLIVNINPGGPNKGSATQYFIGQFDGHKFTAMDNSTRWLDYGPDEYAGVTWDNTGDRRIFLGWMSNWLYAAQVPTTAWRSAMTIPRELRLIDYKGRLLVASAPTNELNRIGGKTTLYNNISLKNPFDLQSRLVNLSGQCILKIETNTPESFSAELSNGKNENVTIGYDKKTNQYYIDRTRSGIVNFNEDFGSRSIAPRLSASKTIQLTLVVDKASVEVFADGGSTVMTGIFFPTETLNRISIRSAQNLVLKSLSYTPLKSIW